MEQTIFYIALVLNLIGLMGTILPVLPGIALSYGSLLLYNFAGAGSISAYTLALLGILSGLSLVMNYWLPIEIAKRYKGSPWGSWGCIVGTCIGLFLPIPLGVIVGMLAGTFAAEYLYYQSPHTALRATWGALLGMMISTLFTMSIAISMLIVLLYNYFNQ